MVRLSNNSSNNINISTNNSNDVNLSSFDDTNVNANTFGNSQRARSWAIGEGLIDGEDYSAKYYAKQAKQSENIVISAMGQIETFVEAADLSANNAANSASNALTSETNAQIWAEGTDEEVVTLGGIHSSKGWVDYILENAPTATTTQTSTGAIITVSDIIHGTTTANLSNGFSPSASVTKTGMVATISITDRNGTTTANIYDGLGNVNDVLVNGTSVVSDGIANILIKYGSSLSYSSNVLQLLDQDGNALGNPITIQSSPDIDGTTISTNSDDELQAIGVIDDNGGSAIKTWTGTRTQYDAIVTKDSTTLYFLTDVGKIYFGDTLISNIGNNTLLDFKWTDHQLNDIQWLRADTFSWQAGNVYVTAYNHLVDDIDGITAETETIGSYTVTFYRATDGHKICLADQEQTVLNIYNTYGIAWYYVLDTTNTQFKLPRTKYGFEGLRTNVGDKIDESLPNIRGGFDTIRNYYVGAFASNGWSDNLVQSGTGITASGITFDASLSSSTYQDNAPVQERATQMYLYFYVGDYTQSAIEQTAGLNSELFNGKLDLNASNLSSQGMSYVAGLGMPSDKYIDLTLGATGASYTAPANGWVFFQDTGNQPYSALVLRTSILRVSLTPGSSGNPIMSVIMPVKKGDVFYAEYADVTGANRIFRFIYAEGSESEAQ